MESPQVDLNARAHVSHFDAHVSHESCTRFTWTPRTFHMDGAHVSHGTPHMFLQSVESANKAIRTPVRASVFRNTANNFGFRRKNVKKFAPKNQTFFKCPT